MPSWPSRLPPLFPAVADAPAAAVAAVESDPNPAEACECGGGGDGSTRRVQAERWLEGKVEKPDADMGDILLLLLLLVMLLLDHEASV